jgi:spermidine/putrescine ABC transporter ATP-binding subunit
MDAKFNVELNGVSKKFGDVVAVDDVSLGVEKGSFQTLLGPSGCGKTTLLRIIAGFEKPDKGDIIINGIRVNDVPPHKRAVGLVFQSYALFPHMTVHDNIAYGLKIKKVPKREIPNKVKNVLDVVNLPGVESRYPKQLSGGQQQRVALARAMVNEPALLLLDEPLSNLDYKLRQQMRIELKRIQNEIGITSIFVTHDQEEAFTLSDQVIVLNQGKKVQVGSPTEIYDKPVNEFIAQFVGQANFFKGKISGIGKKEMIVTSNEGLEIFVPLLDDMDKGTEVIVMSRSERVQISQENSPTLRNSFPAQIEFVSFLGSTIQYVCSIGEKKVISTCPFTGCVLLKTGEKVRVEWSTEDSVVLTK